MKRVLKLAGNALDIYLSASQLSLVMAKDIIRDNITPRPQVGEVVEFDRLTHEENLIEEKKSGLDYFVNMVRMLDAPTYPSAYILYGDLKISFNDIRETKGVRFGNYTVEVNKDAN